MKLIQKIENTSDKKIALILLLTAFVLRAIYVIAYYYNTPIPEKFLYVDLAKEIIDQGKIFYDTSDPYFDVVGPILPWLNAVTMLIFGKNYLGLYIITAIGSALITFFTYKTSRLILDKKTSVLIGFWSLFYLFYFFYSARPGKDIWMAFFMIICLYLILKIFEKNKFTYKSFFFFTLLYVVSFHHDERYVIFAPFIFFLILYYENRSASKFQLKKTLLFSILVLMLMVPWTIRNYNKFGKIVILSTRTERYTDKLFGYEPKEDYFSDDFTSIKGLYYIHDYQIDSVINGEKKNTDAGYKIPEQWRQTMGNGNLPSPLTGISAVFSRLTTMFEPFQIKGRFERTGYYYYKKSFRHNVATFLFYGILFLFSFIGFYHLYKINKASFYIFITVIVLYGLLHGLTIPYTNWRYRLPLDSIFIIVGCLGINKTFIFLKTNLLNKVPSHG